MCGSVYKKFNCYLFVHFVLRVTHCSYFVLVTFFTKNFTIGKDMYVQIFFILKLKSLCCTWNSILSTVVCVLGYFFFKVIIPSVDKLKTSKCFLMNAVSFEFATSLKLSLYWVLYAVPKSPAFIPFLGTIADNFFNGV